MLTVTAVNDTPDSIALNSLNIAENSAGGVVGNLSTTDVDAGDSHTYSVSDNRFEVSGSQLKLKDGISLDHETEGSVSVTVTSTDSAGASVDQQFTLNVTDANDAPVISGAVNKTANEDNSFTLTQAELLANATDADNDVLSVSNVSVASGSVSVTDNGDGSWTVNPVANWSGAAQLSFDVSDGVVTVTGQADLTITADADAPVLTIDTSETVLSEWGFENTQISSGWQSVTSAPQGWSSSTGTYEFQKNGFDSNTAHEGNQWLELDTDNTFDSISYQTDTSAGQNLILQMAVKKRGTADTDDIEIYWGGELVTTLSPNSDWAVQRVVLPAQDQANTTLEIRESSGQNNGLGALVDDLKILQPGVEVSANSDYDYQITSVEDTAIPLGLSSTLIDSDGSETLTLSLSGIPAGFSLTDGTNSLTADGSAVDISSWSLTNITLTPATNHETGFALTLSSTATETVDGDSAATSKTIHVDLLAAQDAAVISGDDSGSVTEDAASTLTTSGTLSASDVDAADTGFTAETVSGSYGSIAINAAGEWTYSADNSQAVIQSLASGETLTDSIDVRSADGTQHTIEITVTGTDDAPVAFGVDLGSVVEDGSFSITQAMLLANASDIDGDSLSVTSVSIENTAQGSVTDNGNGTWTFTPAANLSADDVEFSFVVSDGSSGDEVTATATIDVTGVADAPTVSFANVTDSDNPQYNTDEDSAVAINLSAALTDQDGSETLGVVLSGIPAGATISDGTNSELVSGGSLNISGWDYSALSVLPPVNSHDDFDLSLAVTASEAGGDTSTVNKTITVQVAAVDDAPVSGNVDLGSTAEDTPVVITQAQLLASASDVDGDSLSVTGVSVGNGAHGAVTDNGNGTWTFTPAADYNGTDVEFSFTVSDGSAGDEVTATATIDVTATDDDAVVANPISSQSVNEDSALNFTVPENTFTHADGDTLTYTASLGDGSALPDWLSFDAATRTFSGTPDNGDVATLNLKVTASDEDGETTDASFNLVVNNVNDNPAPVFAESNGLISIEAEHFSSSVGRSGNSWSVVNDGSASGGQQVDTSNNDAQGFNEDYTGTSSELTYDIQFDAAGTYYVWVRGEADDSRSDSVHIGINGEAVSTGSRIDFDGTSHDWAGNRMDGAGRVTIQVDAPGVHQLNLWMREDGTAVDKIVISDDVNYTPSGSGPDELNYVGITDQTTAEEAAFSYTIDANAFNDADGDSLTYSATLTNGDPLPAWISFDAETRTFSGTPDDADLGAIQVRVTASDGSLSSSADVSITVTNVNDAPVANADLATSTGSIATLGSDNDQGFTITASGSVSAYYRPYKAFDGVEAHDTNNRDSWAVGGNSGWLQVEMPAAQRVGMYSIKAINFSDRQPKDWELLASNDGVNYTVIDSHSGVDNWSPRETKEFMVDDAGLYTHFKINITDNNGNAYTGFDGFQLFEWSNTTAHVEEDQTLSFDVLVNDTDADNGDTLTLDSVQIVDGNGDPLSGKGIATIVDGKLQFDPNGDFASLRAGDSETITVRYTISDASGAQSTSTTEVTVFGTEHTPVAGNVDLGSTNEDTAVVITKTQLLASATDADGDSISISSLSLTNGVQGTLIDNGNDTWTFTPASNFNGDDVAFSFTVSDGGRTASASATIDVAAVNDAADLIADTDSGNANVNGSAINSSASVLANDSDIEGDSLTVTQVSGTAISGATTISGDYGDLVIAADGSWTYNPDTPDLDTGLVGHWKFDGNTTDSAEGDAITDTGVLKGDAATNGSGLNGSSLNLINNGDSFLINDSAEIDQLAFSERTINFSFRIDEANDLSGRQVLFEEGGVTRGLNAYMDSGKLYVGGYDNSIGWDGTWVRVDIPDDNDFHNLSLVLGSNELSAYLDGNKLTDTVMDVSTGTKEMSNGHQEFNFGARHADTVFHDGTHDDSSSDAISGTFIGEIDEARIYNRALDEQALNALNYEHQSGTLQDTFTYTVSDGTDTSTATLTIDVNRVPEAISGTVSGADDNNIVGQLTAKDLDAGETLTYSLESAPAKGSVTVNADGSYTFNPGADFESLSSVQTEDVTFDFKVTDSQGQTSVNTVTVTVTGTNVAPELTELPMFDSVVAAYNFSDGSGATASDSSGNGNDISLSGSAGFGTGRNGSGTAFEMNGSAGGGDLGNITTGGEMSISAWVKFDDFSQSWSRIVDFGNGSNDHNIILAHEGTTNSLGFHIYPDSGTEGKAELTIDNFFTAGEWVHVTATVDSNGAMRVYKNGELAGENPDGAVPPEMVRSGNYVGKSHWFNDGVLDGSVDDLAVFDSALSSSQIKALYQADSVDNLLGDSLHIAENSADSTSVGTVAASDTNNDSLTYSLTDDAGGRFAINSSTGEITVANGSLLDHETTGNHSVTVQVSDGYLTDSRSYTIYVTNANDAPDSSDATVTAGEDAALTLTAANFSFSDEDSGDGLEAVVITSLPAEGSLTLNGAAVTANQSISKADIDAGLLKYTPAEDVSGNARTSFNFKVSDGDATSANSYTLTVNVTPDADAPEITVAGGNAVTVNEDANIAIDLTTSLTDTDGSETLAVSLSGIPSGYGLGDGTNSVTSTGAAIDVTGWNMSQLQLTPVANANADFTITVSATATESVGGDTSTTTQDINVNVVPVNDGPTGADASFTLNEDGSRTITAGDFGFSDIDTGDSLQQVQISTLPGNGSLKLNGVAVTDDQVISKADIDAGLLVFSPDANEAGNNYANVGFKVHDGTEFSASENTLTFDVTALADTPTLNDISTEVLNSNFNGGNQDGWQEHNPYGSGSSAFQNNQLYNWNGREVFRDVDTSDSSVQTYELTFTLYHNKNSYHTSNVWVKWGGQTVATYTESAGSGTVTSTKTIRLQASGDPTTQLRFDQDTMYFKLDNIKINKVIETDEDTALSLPDLGLALVDTDGSESLSAEVTGAPAGAILTDGTNTVTSDGSAIDISGWNSASLQITPPADSSDDINLTFTATSTDSNGDTATTSESMSITVNAVNDKPVTEDGNLMLRQGDSYSFDENDFKFTDVDTGDSLQSITITSLPASGSLTLNGSAVTANQVISLADIAQLKYTAPATDADVGTSFGFTVSDGSLSSDAQSFALNVRGTLSDNLLNNANAQNGTTGWNIVANGGAGWGIEGASHDGDGKSWGTSYQWNKKSQTVDLLAKGFTEEFLDSAPEINVSDWFRNDYNNDSYFLKVQLKDAGGNTIASFDTGTLTATSSWQEASKVFSDYGEGVRSIYFEHGGKDSEYWGGQYGARIDDSEVVIKVGDVELKGSADDDIIQGSERADTIKGEAGSDTLLGDDGADLIFGGAGDDVLTGGNDADTFIWNSSDLGTAATPAEDTITDFQAGQGGDMLDLSDVLVDDSEPLEDYLSLNFENGSTTIEVKPDVNGGVTQKIKLEGVDLSGYGGGTNDAEILNSLLSDGNLQIDP